ncbi:MAG: hypothetical protein V7K50_21170 [Nostoc sp.]
MLLSRWEWAVGSGEMREMREKKPMPHSQSLQDIAAAIAFELLN